MAKLVKCEVSPHNDPFDGLRHWSSQIQSPRLFWYPKHDFCALLSCLIECDGGPTYASGNHRIGLKAQLHVIWGLELRSVGVCEIDGDNASRDDTSIVLNTCRVNRTDVDDGPNRETVCRFAGESYRTHNASF